MKRTIIPILYIFYSSMLGAQHLAYDEQGRLIADNANGILLIEWNKFNKVSRVETKTAEIDLSYDSKGNRVRKIVKLKDGDQLSSQASWEYTYYENDASGNELGRYRRKFEKRDATQFSDLLSLSENKIQGGKLHRRSDEAQVRVDFTATEGALFTDIVYKGMLISAQTLESAKSTCGDKRYELIAHNRSVGSVVTDRKIQRNAELVFAQHYYPFGMAMTRYTSGDQPYHYGFGGKETNKDWTGIYNHYDFGARLYDARIGRWWSVDKMYAKEPGINPYQYAHNSPLSLSDPDGNEAVFEVSYNKGQKGGKVVISADIAVANGSAAFIHNYKKILSHHYTSKKWVDYRTGHTWTLSFKFNVMPAYEAIKKLQAQGLLVNPAGSKNTLFNSPTIFVSQGRSNTSEFFLDDDGITSNMGYNNFRSWNAHTLIHETGHYLGLSDRYIDKDVQKHHTSLSIAEAESGLTNNDMMDGGFLFSQTHVENWMRWTLAQNPDPTLTKDIIFFQRQGYVDQLNRKLIGPYLTVPYLRNRSAYWSVRRAEQLRIQKARQQKLEAEYKAATEVFEKRE